MNQWQMLMEIQQIQIELMNLHIKHLGNILSRPACDLLHVVNSNHAIFLVGDAFEKIPFYPRDYYSLVNTARNSSWTPHIPDMT